jgi:peptidoglycan DL-endopeptidase CwlO
VRDVNRRLATCLWAAVAAGVIVTISPVVHGPHLATAAGPATRPSAGSDGSGAANGGPADGRRSRSGGQPDGEGSGMASGQEAGTYIPESDSAALTVPVAELTARVRSVVAPLRQLRPADLLVVAPRTLPATALAGVRRLKGVAAAELLDAARVKLDGSYVATLGVDPSQFRAYSAKPTARSTVLWQNVADGGIAVSYLMGQQRKLPLGGTVQVTGSRTEQLRVGGFGTVGISGVDAVVSTQVALSLGMPSGNAIVISAPDARLSVLMRQLGLVLPRDASVVPLVGQGAAAGLPVTTGSAGGVGITAADGPALTVAQTRAFLAAAESRVGMKYVWGGSGPDVFDCSGLVQWSMRQAGIVMPRVAVDQAQTGPLIPLSELEPGDLLFYHTDPTAPTYISHVAIYLGHGLMEQAPEPGMDVQIVPAVFNGGFAGAVQVYPRVAAAVEAEVSD